MKRSLRQDLAKTADKDGDDIHPQLLGQIEGAAMETLYMTISRTRTFWEYHHRIALADFLGKHIGHLLRIANRKEVSISDDNAIERIVPHPILSKYYQIGSQQHNSHQIKVRLMVTNDD